MSEGITLKTVSTPADFALLSWQPGAWDSAFYMDGVLNAGEARFFPEIFVELELNWALQEGMADRETVLIRCEGDPEGWELVVDGYGYLELRALAPGTVTFRAGTPLTTFTGSPFRLGVTIANVCYPWRESRWWREALLYSRVTLLGARGTEGRLCALGEWGLEAPGLQPVPNRVVIPAGSPVSEVRAYNTVRHELFERTVCPDGPHVDGAFPDSSRAFAFCEPGSGLVDVFTGPELFRSDSYWLFSRVVEAVPGETRLRVHTASGYARRFPGMSPRFFWSPDRVVWDEVVQLEPSDESGRFYSLLEAPAESFYLSTSFPFMQHELAQLLAWVEDVPFVSTRTLGASVEGRPIPLVTIGDTDVPDDRKTHVVLIVGQHSPMEMVGAHTIEPIIRYVTAHPDVLQSVTLHCVPVVNVDCAAYGSDGMNMNLRNTNRCWFDDIQPETRCIMDYFDTQEWEPDLFLDLHAGGCWRNHTLLRFAPAFLRERFGPLGDDLIARQTVVNGILERHAGIRSADGIDHVFRECCAKDWFKVHFPRCVSCDLELSLCTYFDPSARLTKPVTQSAIEEMGTGLGAAFAEFAATFGPSGGGTG